MNDNYPLFFEGNTYQVNDPYHLVSRNELLDALAGVKANMVEKNDVFELEILQSADLLVIGADGGVLFCRVKQMKGIHECAFLIHDKYSEENKYRLSPHRYRKSGMTDIY